MTNSVPLQEGDLVQLKSGGPVMSLQMIAGARASCMWFDQDGKLHERTFQLDTLRRVDNKGDLSES